MINIINIGPPTVKSKLNVAPPEKPADNKYFAAIIIPMITISFNLYLLKDCPNPYSLN
jgi:hypothetical protein